MSCRQRLSALQQSVATSRDRTREGRDRIATRAVGRLPRNVCNKKTHLLESQGMPALVGCSQSTLPMGIASDITQDVRDVRRVLDQLGESTGTKHHLSQVD